MGYYSFYKIIKDMLKTLFGNKILRFIIITCLIVLCLSLKTTVFGAYDTTIECSGTFGYDLQYDSSLFGDLNYIINIRKSNSNIYYSIYISNYDLSHFTSVSNGSYYRVNIPVGYKMYNSSGTIDNYDTLNSTSASNQLAYRIRSAINSYNSSSPVNNNTPIKYLEFTSRQLTEPTYFTSNGIIFIDDEEFYNPNPIKYPKIANSLSDLQTLNFDVISIDGWDWSNKDIDVLFYDRNVKDTSTTEGLYPKRVITLNQNTSYFQAGLTADPNKNAIYWIPIDEIGLNLYVGGSYEIRLAERVPLDPPEYGADYYYNYLGDPVSFTISSDVSQDRINAINKEIEDTTNKKYHDETINKMDNINNNINNLNNNINNVNDALTNTTPDGSVSSDIDNSLNFDNQNEGLNNLNNGFFSRLTSILSNLLGYNLSEDTSVSIPFPNSDKHLILHSKDIYDNVTGAIRVIINAFWVYIFTFYLWKFINKIYIAVSTGNILNSFSSSGEAITNDML